MQISVAAQDGIADPKARGVGAELIERMKASLPGHAMHLAYAAMQKLSDYQDLDYAKLYLESWSISLTLTKNTAANSRNVC